MTLDTADLSRTETSNVIRYLKSLDFWKLKSMFELLHKITHSIRTFK